MRTVIGLRSEPVALRSVDRECLEKECRFGCEEERSIGKGAKDDCVREGKRRCV